MPKDEMNELKKTDNSKVLSQAKNNSASCQRPLSEEEETLRKGRKSLISLSPAQSEKQTKGQHQEQHKEQSRSQAKNKVRYIEGTTPLKDGCWLSD